MARDSAADRLPIILRYYLAGSAPDGTRFFRRLGVTVRDSNVYKGSGLRNDVLGSLAGACAEVLERDQVAPTSAMITYELTGVRPEAGMVSVPGGGDAPGEKVVQLREGHYTGFDRLWAQVLREINEFNARAAGAAGK